MLLCIMQGSRRSTRPPKPTEAALAHQEDLRMAASKQQGASGSARSVAPAAEVSGKGCWSVAGNDSGTSSDDSETDASDTDASE